MRLRQALVAFLTTVYLFVGLVHASAHVNEVLTQVNDAVPATISLAMSAAATDGSDEGDAKTSSAVDEYCQVYAPSVMPVLAFVAIPQAQAVDLLFVTPSPPVKDVHGLDTPPPKHLT